MPMVIKIIDKTISIRSVVFFPRLFNKIPNIGTQPNIITVDKINFL